MADAAPGADTNLLLASLSAREQRRLLRRAEAVALETNEVLYEPGQPIEYVHFPTKGCVLSVLRGLDPGKSFDAGLVGYDGLVGVERFLGVEEAQFGATVRVGGGALRLQAEALRAQTQDGGKLTEVLQRYVQYLLLAYSQKVGCNRFHSLERHFCSWLLLLHDRIVGNQLAITQAIFARMLGVRHVGISQAARKLQKAGVLRYSWGELTILDRGRLEENACTCYQQFTQSYQRLLDGAWPYR